MREMKNHHPIDLASVIDARPISLFQWRVVGLCAVVAILDGFDTQAIAFVAPIVSEEFGIAKDEMGRVFAAALLGLMIGAFGFSPVADRIGRKPVIIISCAIMGVFCLLTATASNTEQLLLYRFVTGLGLGGAMPNINTLTSEYAPARSRAFLMTLMFIGFPLGAVLGGILSTYLIAWLGWQSVFWLGGAAPILLIFILIPALPESIRFRAMRNPSDPRIGAALSKIGPSRKQVSGAHVQTNAQTATSGSIFTLFSGSRRTGTLLIWVVFFSNLLMMYTLMNWLPAVMRESGLALNQAIITTVIFNLG
ncbi:MAG: MFS transporter, partial [Pseudomonadota bacterium]